eukprot:GEMP01052217.1.p1 GENE.GEMP01052217.1~~GEMP01052217.1.p1  ORF type:complete len:437 (+),score=62.57 GEMP01052217.1:242-1552(+)
MAPPRSSIRKSATVTDRTASTSEESRKYDRSAMMRIRFSALVRPSGEKKKVNATANFPIACGLKMMQRPSKKTANRILINQVCQLIEEMQICPKSELAERFRQRYGETFVMTDSNPSVLSSFLTRCCQIEIPADEMLRSEQDANPVLQFAQTLVAHAIASVGKSNHLDQPLLDPETNIWWGGEERVPMTSFNALWDFKYQGVYDLSDILQHLEMTLEQLLATTPGVLQDGTTAYRTESVSLVATDILFPPKEFPAFLVHAGRTNLVTLMSDPRFPLTLQPLHASLALDHPWREVIVRIKRMLYENGAPMRVNELEQSAELRSAVKECGPIGLESMLKFFPKLFIILPKTGESETTHVTLHSSAADEMHGNATKGHVQNKASHRTGRENTAPNGNKHRVAQHGVSIPKHLVLQPWRYFNFGAPVGRNFRPKRRNSLN